MTFDVEIRLIKNTVAENSMGDLITTKTKRTIWAAELTYRNRSFHQAMTDGHKPSITFGISKYEYDGEKELEYKWRTTGGENPTEIEGAIYSIIDITPVKEKDMSEFETIALICEGLVV